MFTLEQIKTAHSQVKSGADFPKYIRDIQKLGVTAYEVFVSDGHTDYYGKNDFKITSSAKYDTLPLSKISHSEKFTSDLLAHQQGKTDYMAFCLDCANSGIEKWIVNIAEMTCTYYDVAGTNILTEIIPHV